MSTPQNGFRRSLDSSPLILEQLSDHELTIILSIERELEVKRVDASKQGKTEKSYLASVQIRSPNVLLLDGARGTGKTSMLLTMAHRWNLHSNCEVERHDYDCEQYRARIDRIRRSQPELDGKIPKQFHPLRILDFDPIPPQMPLIAGIVHAWQPLAATYDESTGFPSDYDYEGETLQDRWEKLFRVAAVGWSSISPAKGLLDQVLDRQEQVHEWQNLGQRWHEFVAEVIRRGKGMPEPHRLAGNPIFVIMIDDVDLQVERIRELLPALRLLYHPNVAFLVAADWDHLVATLRTDFLGQHNRIASLPANSSTTSVEYEKTWTGILANAAATKVFPLKNKWALKRLNLHELLAFPKSVADACESDKADRALPLTMRAILNEWPRRPNDVKLGDYLFRRAGPAEEPHEIPPFITYRDAHQLFERASTQGDGLLGAIEAVRLLISDSDAEAVSFERAVGPEALVEYKADGELAALFRPGYIEETSASSGIEVGASPYFIARRGVFSGGVSMQDNVSANGNCTREMLAITLQDGDYGVVAPALRWNIRLALAWTRVRVTIADAFLNLAFQWRFHEHPDPLRLFAWSREWRQFGLSIQTSPEERLERIAYAWIFYQVKWHDADINDLPDPVKTSSLSVHDWGLLLEKEPIVSPGLNQNRVRLQDWRTQTLPLLARPEIGLPPELQEKLLSYVVVSPDELDERIGRREWLKYQRRRLVTDAIIAGGEDEGRRAENPSLVEDLVREFETRYKELYGRDSPWSKDVEAEVEM